MGNEAEEEALRLKTLAEDKYKHSNLKSALKYAKRALRLSPSLDGVSEMVTAFKILRVATKSTGVGTPDWYKILQIEPFSHINSIKKQYKKLALTLHPDKNSFAASEEAFKLVGDAFRFLSDKIRRKEYDLKLRIAIQSAATAAGGGSVVPGDTFWTACSTCRLLHQFERKYIGHILMCPSCKKSFKAVEVSANESNGEDTRVGTRVRVRVRVGGGGGSSVERSRIVGSKQKMSSVGELLERLKSKRVERSRIVDTLRVTSSVGEVLERSKRVERSRIVDTGRVTSSVGEVLSRLRSKRVERSRIVDMGQVTSSVGEVLSRSRSKRAKIGKEMTLAQMQLEAKRKAQQEKLKLKLKEKRKGNLKEDEKKEKKKGERRGASKSRDLEIMVVEDADFYDFDKDRVERSFKKGQVWAIYDDDDGMPRHYGLVDEVISVTPFEVKMSWLDLQNNGDEGLICWEKLGFHVSCGRFKVAKKTLINSVNVFSHVVECERAAREIYRIYPKKGSVWALYNEEALDTEGRKTSVKDKRCYDIVVFLTSYSEMHGLSMAYIEKVDGFKTVFKRREIGCHAIRWLEKDDVRLFSHQIPARKLSGEEAPDLSKDCWELDPASLPPELLTIGWGG